MAFSSDARRRLSFCRSLIAALVVTATPLSSFAAEGGKSKPAATKQEAAAPTVALKKFLSSVAGTRGWEIVKRIGGDWMNYDFLPDGRLAMEGSDGEETMWEGRWWLEGNMLTMTNSERKTKTTVTAIADGKELLLDGVRYRRHKP